MFDSLASPYTESLGDNLTLKSISTRDEIERLAAFNLYIHGEDGIDAMTRELILHHPDTRPEHWLFVEDDSSGQIVSSLCLIPWTWRFEDVELKAGEMGIVGTHEDYRRRGLIRALDRRFKMLLDDGAYDVSQIQGIPYYYRQFGYEYTLPLEGGWEIMPHQIPDADDDAPRFTFRQATRDDLPCLMRWYDDLTHRVTIHTARSETVWRYLFDYCPETATVGEFWLVLDEDDRPVGYWRIELGGFGSGLNVNEASQLSHPTAVAVLRYLKTLAIERDKPYIRFHPMPDHILIQAAKAWGAVDKGHYAWQIYLPDVARLLRKLTPVFERRIATSAFAGLTDVVTLNLYREAFDLRFEAGRLRAVESVGFRPWEGTPNIPPQAFVPLVFGYRTREELRAVYPDVSIWGQAQVLIDVLFPKTSAFLHAIY